MSLAFAAAWAFASRSGRRVVTRESEIGPAALGERALQAMTESYTRLTMAFIDVSRRFRERQPG
jgi:hypothetical protein